jgi:regulatory protein
MRGGLASIVTRLRLLRHRELSKGMPQPQADDPGDGPDATGSATGDTTETATLHDARNAAMRMLVHREFSVAELMDRLESRGYARPISQRVVQQLREEGLQSDSRFAEVYARSRLERGSGPMLLRAEMRARGLDETLIDEYVTQSHEYWVGLAVKAVGKRFKAAPTTRDAWGEQARFLARKGFSADLIYAALGNQRY